MVWLLKRLREPSTWLGFAMLIPQVGAVIAAGQITAAGVATIAGGIAGVLIKEKGSDDAGAFGK